MGGRRVTKRGEGSEGEGRSTVNGGGGDGSRWGGTKGDEEGGRGEGRKRSTGGCGRDEGGMRGPKCGGDYFRKAKKTARTRQAKAAKWFQWRDCPLKTNRTMMENTVREITSWMTLSCMRLNGPPFWA